MIDLYSDTKTRPSPGMRRAIAEAVVGDEQHGEDPTVTQLTDRAAQLLGKEAAVFLPSGTMANEIAMLVHCRPGDEIIAHEDSHLLNFEGGGVAALAGAMVRRVPGPRGMFNLGALQAAIRPLARHLPRSRVLSIEQTTNLGGGAVWDLGVLTELTDCAKGRGLSTHLDGARLFNAVASSGTTAQQYAAPFDSVFIDFTKGLGAPFGAVLAGSRTLVDEAWRWKQRLGGSMRQAGMMAQACLFALDHHIDRLADDHSNAQLLRQLLGEIPGLKVEPVETNMVFCDVSALGMSAAQFNEALLARGIRMSTQGPSRMRAVTYLDVSEQDILTVGQAAALIAAAA